MPPSATAVLRWLLASLLLLLPLRALAAPVPPVWRDVDPSGTPRVHLYFFWSQECPHCQEAKPEVEALAAKHPWLVLHSLEVTADPAAARQYAETAEALGQHAQYVPGFAYCGRLDQGFPGRDVLEHELVECREGAAEPERTGTPGGAREATPTPAPRPAPPPAVDTTVTVPLLGRVDASAWSLPITTVVLAGLDAFNPCAFFVLLFLLSLLVHVRSRARMIAIAGVFILFSGLWYFVFMAAWLNVFLWVGELRWVTLAAGLLAITLGALDIKDYFLGTKGPSRSIPAGAKPSLYRRMRRLVQASSLWAALSGTVVLAAAANTYELLCTAGFPMVYTRVLTLAGLSPGASYLWLALYNAIYVIPLVVIAAVFVKTLGSRKLQEHEGRALKLLSGTMMLGLGLVLVFAPAAMSRMTMAAGLLAAALAVTGTCVAIERRRARKRARARE
jgi:thiol-disulfide isomerase/thioredoxin